MKEARVRANGPSPTTRASSIGHACERALFYERTTTAEERTRHEPGTQAIFDLGNALERYVVRELEDMGCEIVQRGRDYLDRDLELSGHVDVAIRLPGWSAAVIAEIKGLNPYTAESIRDIAGIRESAQFWVTRYYAQLQSYLLLAGGAMGLFVLLNKSTGRITFIEAPRDEECIAGLRAKALRIKAAVAARQAPERRLGSECERCQFRLVCVPDRDFGPGVAVLDSAALEAALVRREQLLDAHREYEGVMEEIKALLPKAPGEVLIGSEWVVLGREINVRAAAKPRDAYSYIRHEISRIKGGEHGNREGA